MQWSFEFSLMVFLLIIFVSQSISTKTCSWLPLPFVMGVICMAGFGTGLFPADFVEQSKLIAVGFIAFNVLVIHSGTSFNIGQLKANWKTALTCLAGVALMTVAVVFGLRPVIGRELALLSPGPIVGGGATAAIASNWVREKAPQFAFYPWMAFMVQTFFGLPLVVWAMKKEAALLLAGYRAAPGVPGAGTGAPGAGMSGMRMPAPPAGIGAPPPDAPGGGLCGRIPARYKTTAYYLGMLMVVSVFNRWLNTQFLAKMNININVTALLFGILLGSLGLMDKNPLAKSDSFGLLLLGLMALMGNTLSKTPVGLILSLVPALLLSFAVATLVLLLTGIAASKICGFSKYRGIMIMANCMLSFPPGVALAKDLIGKLGKNDGERGMLMGALMPSIAVGSSLIVNVVSIFIASFLVNLV